MLASIVLVDDHKILRQGLRVLLEAEAGFKIVGEAGSGDAALGMVEKLQPDVLITDLRMPGLNGIELARSVRVSTPGTAIIMLSMYGDEAYIRQALLAGAKGYVLKESSFEELALAIREVMAGHLFISSGLKYNPGFRSGRNVKNK